MSVSSPTVVAVDAALDVQPVEPIETLDSFRAQSGRFLFAQPRSGGDLVYLEQGTAHERRADVRTALRCPEPDCISPQITTVSRSARSARDGYRHLVRPGRGHAPESVFHRQAKALIVRWAREQGNVASAREEVRVGGGERVADVLLTSFSGNLLAVEIQYASLSFEQWAERTESYQRLGVAVTWLWGHVGAHMPLQGRWREIGAHLVRDARPVLWINPADERIAWAYDLHALQQQPRKPDPPKYQFGPLSGLDLRQNGIFPPGFLDETKRIRDEIEQAERARERRAAEHNEQMETARRRRALNAPQASLRMVEPLPEQDPGPPSEWRRPRRHNGLCPRCGLRLDPSLSVHADPFCDRW
ncbi:hypothetical protein GCM10009843_35680 [Nocardioides bigeumensis]|uniref:Competence protein CoiA nuclease-like domain-containing protein n=1 Tax=Nocardioides bigeumensis TaxID=433657 RepID=A0ABP5KG53_9ACTN